MSRSVRMLSCCRSSGRSRSARKRRRFRPRRLPAAAEGETDRRKDVHHRRESPCARPPSTAASAAASTPCTTARTTRRRSASGWPRRRRGTTTRSITWEDLRGRFWARSPITRRPRAGTRRPPPRDTARRNSAWPPSTKGPRRPADSVKAFSLYRKASGLPDSVVVVERGSTRRWSRPRTISRYANRTSRICSASWTMRRSSTTSASRTCNGSSMN